MRESQKKGGPTASPAKTYNSNETKPEYAYLRYTWTARDVACRLANSGVELNTK